VRRSRSSARSRTRVTTSWTWPSPACGHTVNGHTEELLTGDTASKVRAAALGEVSGTVDRVETNVDSSTPYEAHIRKADGTEVEVQVNRDFSVAAVRLSTS